MLDCSLDWSGCSSDLLVNKMVKWDCSLDSLESRRGLLASTGDSSGCSSVTMAMAEMATSAGKWGLRGCNQGSRRHVPGLVYRGSWQGCPGCQAEDSRLGRTLLGSFHLHHWRQKAKSQDHQGSCHCPCLRQGSRRFHRPFRRLVWHPPARESCQVS